MLKDKLKEYRERCEYSQQQVADCLNIHRSTYSYYELGKTEPSLENIRVLARIFGASLYDLLEVETPELSAADPTRDGTFDPYHPPGDAGTAIDRSDTKIGDLTREERKLIMRFRMLTAKQRADVMMAMIAPDDTDSDR